MDESSWFLESERFSTFGFFKIKWCLPQELFPQTLNLETFTAAHRVYFCIQHGADKAARRAGISATADTFYTSQQHIH